MIKEDNDYRIKVLDILSDLTIDMSSINKNLNEKLKNNLGDIDIDDEPEINFNNISLYNEFYVSINYIMKFIYNLYAEYHNENISARYVTENLIVLMNLTIENRNKYHLDGVEYNTFHSILNILITAFAKINI